MPRSTTAKQRLNFNFANRPYPGQVDACNLLANRLTRLVKKHFDDLVKGVEEIGVAGGERNEDRIRDSIQNKLGVLSLLEFEPLTRDLPSPKDVRSFT